MALPRTIQIEQDPVTRALDSLSRTASSIIEQAQQYRQQNLRVQDMYVARALDNLSQRFFNSSTSSSDMNEMMKAFDSMSSEGSEYVKPLIDVTRSVLSQRLENRKRLEQSMNELENTVKAVASKGGDFKESYDVIQNTLKRFQKEYDESGIYDQQMLARAGQMVGKTLDELFVLGRISQKDVDKNKPGVQFGRNIGPIEKTLYKEASDVADIDVRRALGIIEGIPSIKAQDVLNEKAESRRIDKAIAAEKKIETKSENEVISNLVTKLNNTMDLGGYSSKIPRVSAKVLRGDTGTVDNIKEVMKQTAYTMYRIQKDRHDFSIPSELKKFADIIEEAEKTGRTKTVYDEDGNVKAYSLNDALIKFADMWAENSDKVSKLDMEKTFEFISDDQEKNRYKAFIDAIDLYRKLDKTLKNRLGEFGEIETTSGTLSQVEKQPTSTKSNSDTLSLYNDTLNVPVSNIMGLRVR